MKQCNFCFCLSRQKIVRETSVTYVKVAYAMVQIDALDENGEDNRPNGIAERDAQKQLFPRCLDVPEAYHFHEDPCNTHRSVLLTSRHAETCDFLTPSRP